MLVLALPVYVRKRIYDRLIHAVKTIAGHKEALAALGRACKPNSPLDITPKMMRTFRLVLLDKGLSVHTINKHIRVVRSALSYAVRAEIIPSNKLLGPHRLCLRAENKVPRILEVGEITALMNVSTDLRHRTAVSLAYYHGLRRGEFCYLQWQDIDFEECRLDIANRQEARTKTRKSRTIALRRESAGLLAELYQGRVNEYVFANPGDFYLSCDKWFKRLVKSAGLDHCTLHDLRKTCNTLMKDAGVSQEAAMQVLGHSSVHVNQQYYTGILTEQQRTAVDSLPTVG